jgi:hypothetical protein
MNLQKVWRRFLHIMTIDREFTVTVKSANSSSELTDLWTLDGCHNNSGIWPLKSKSTLKKMKKKTMHTQCDCVERWSLQRV